MEITKTNSDLLKLSSLLLNKINQGFVILERNDKLPYAILIKSKTKVDHVSNFFFFCATLGVLSLPWIYITKVSSKAKKILIAIDEEGNAFEEKCF